jgi:hypothetical protein
MDVIDLTFATLAATHALVFGKLRHRAPRNVARARSRQDVEAKTEVTRLPARGFTVWDFAIVHGFYWT